VNNRVRCTLIATLNSYMLIIAAGEDRSSLDRVQIISCDGDNHEQTTVAEKYKNNSKAFPIYCG
jgi:hypothetical protein